MSRDAILKAVRAANQARPGPAREHIAPAPRIDRPSADLQAELVRRLESCGVCVEKLKAWNDVPAAVARVLTAARLALTLRLGCDPQLSALPWHTVAGISRKTGAASRDDQASLSRALFGIAETGTVLLASGADNPVTLAFLPELHIVALDREKIVASLEEALSRVGDETSSNNLPRTVNLISGASRTGDIGGRLVMGAHGPRQLVVLIAG